LLIGSIFRHESEHKEEDTPVPVKTVITPPEEPEYSTSPPIDDVASNSSVPNFVVNRKGFGSISFKDPVDLTDISSLAALCEIVKIERGTAVVYPKESNKPPVGSGLNVRAKVSLENYRHPPGIEPHEFLAELQSIPDTEFISYDSEAGNWQYNVQHF
jgi:nuclear pore complex protein Nup98-Nup96